MTIGCVAKWLGGKWVYLALVLVLAGCSNKFIYTNLDWVVLEYIDDYVTLDRDQEAMLDERLQQLLYWHQEQELPLYISQLNTLENIDSGQVTAQFVVSQRELIKQHTTRLATQVAPDLYALILSLSTKQEEELLKNLAKKYQELDNKYGKLSELERRERYVERIEESLKRWIGRLTKQQKALVKGWVNDLQLTTPHWREHRNKMLAEVRKLLVNKHDSHYLHDNLMRFLLEPESYYSVELGQKVAFNLELANQYIPKISQTMTPKQWQHFRSEIQGWRNLAVELNTQVAEH